MCSGSVSYGGSHHLILSFLTAMLAKICLNEENEDFFGVKRFPGNESLLPVGKCGCRSDKTWFLLPYYDMNLVKRETDKNSFVCLFSFFISPDSVSLSYSV